jgi:hypothetical protein
MIIQKFTEVINLQVVGKSSALDVQAIIAGVGLGNMV